MTDSLCFSCRLPDCDDASPRCALRRASNRLRGDMIAGRSARDADRAADTEWHIVRKFEREARRSEGATS